MRTPILLTGTLWGVAIASSPPGIPAEEEARLRSALTLYASFDEEVRGDFSRGVAAPSTRRDNPEVKGGFIFKEGIDERVFRIAKGKGVHRGALEVVDVLPHRGRIFFPAKGNLAYRRGGWGGAVSFWLNTDPNQLLKTPFCDPVQITEKGAGNGGIWIDFPDQTPRDLRLGAFPAVAEGQQAISETDPQAPIVQVKNVGFKSGDWHHLVMSWDRLDSEKEDAVAELYIDGERKGRLEGRKLAMQWDLDHTGIYFAVNYVGLLDELAVFNRPLTPEEVRHLHQRPGALAGTK